MSFDLFVYFTPPAAGLKARWEGALADEGLPLRFPEGTDLLEVEEGLVVTWAAQPRLIALSRGETQTHFPYFESGPIDAGELEEDLAEAPPLLRERLKSATHRAFFSSSAGRSADGLALQLFGAAALAKAGEGVMHDPQQGRYTSGDEALVDAHDTLAAYRDATVAEEGFAARRAAARESLDLRWRWFQGLFFASCAVWAALVAFLFAIEWLKVDASAGWVPVVTIVPLFGAAVLVARSTRYLAEELDVPWPLPWLLGVISVFPPFHAIVYAWMRKRYRRLRPA